MTRMAVDTEDKWGDVNGVGRHAWSNSPVLMLLGSCIRKGEKSREPLSGTRTIQPVGHMST